MHSVLFYEGDADHIMDERYKKMTGSLPKPVIFGPSGESRTHGLLNPIQARYQTALHPDVAADPGGNHYYTAFVLICQSLFGRKMRRDRMEMRSKKYAVTGSRRQWTSAIAKAMPARGKAAAYGRDKMRNKKAGMVYRALPAVPDKAR